MNQQIKQQWVDALRSGTYAQGQMELRAMEDDRYCVNGVLCDLHSQAHGRKGWIQLGHRRAWFYLENHSFPAKAVRAWADIHEDTLTELERLNDARGREGLSFEELALYIENNL
jgi:hypothetical protein